MFITNRSKQSNYSVFLLCFSENKVTSSIISEVSISFWCLMHCAWKENIQLSMGIRKETFQQFYFLFHMVSLFILIPWWKLLTFQINWRIFRIYFVQICCIFITLPNHKRLANHDVLCTSDLFVDIQYIGQQMCYFVTWRKLAESILIGFRLLLFLG